MNQYRREHVFYICFSKSSKGKELCGNFRNELEIENTADVKTYSRQDACNKLKVVDSDNNIVVLEEIISKLPENSVAMFDEVPLTSEDHVRPSFDWSSLKNTRGNDVTVVVCLQPLLSKVTLKSKGHTVMPPGEADVINLTRQYRSSTKIMNLVNKLCQEDLPIEYNCIETRPSHEVEGPEVNLIGIVTETDKIAFKGWFKSQMINLACCPSQLKVIHDHETEELAKAIVSNTKFNQSLATLDEVQGCEFPIVMVLFSKSDNYSQLLEMCSRAQHKLFLVIQGHPTLFNALDKTLVVKEENMRRHGGRLSSNKSYELMHIKTKLKMAYLFGDISRKEAEYQLQGWPPGSFLVRQTGDDYKLSRLNFNSRLKHSKIFQENETFYLKSEKKFESILELIRFHQNLSPGTKWALGCPRFNTESCSGHADLDSGDSDEDQPKSSKISKLTPKVNATNRLRPPQPLLQQVSEEKDNNVSMRNPMFKPRPANLILSPSRPDYNGLLTSFAAALPTSQMTNEYKGWNQPAVTKTLKLKPLPHSAAPTRLLPRDTNTLQPTQPFPQPESEKSEEQDLLMKPSVRPRPSYLMLSPSKPSQMASLATENV